MESPNPLCAMTACEHIAISTEAPQMRIAFGIFAAPLCAAILFASPAWAQPVATPPDQAQASTRSDDGAEAGTDDSGAQVDSFKSVMKKVGKGIKKGAMMMKDVHTGFAHEAEVDDAQPQERAMPVPR
jgi:hypothetical protein